MAKKKILHIVEAFGGGVFTFLSDLLNDLVNDYEVVVAYAFREQTPSDFKSYFDENIKFIEVKHLKRSINLKNDFIALLEIKKIIKNEKPDIVHLHSSKAGILGRIVIHRKNIRMFYNPHGFSFLKMDDSKLKRLIYRVIEKCAAIINKKCIIVGCSKGEFLEAKKLNKNSICINNGINIGKLDKELKDLNQDKINYHNLKICTVGRIDFQKNPKDFNNVAELFPQKQFTWIGDGSLKKELTSSNINVTGWLTRKKVLEKLCENNIFILTSLWEGLPISLLEAMYMKKICIVSNVIGNRDVIQHSKNGYIYNSMEELQNILNNIENEKEENIEKLINRAYDDIITNYNMSSITEEYKKIYKE